MGTRWKCNIYNKNEQQTIKNGKTIMQIRNNVENSLQIGKKYRLQSERDEKPVRMKLIAFLPHVVVFQKPNGTIETFTYQDIFHKTGLCG